MSYLGSVLDYPIGHIQPLTVSSGGGSSTTGSATFKYTSLTDPPAPEYTQSVDEVRFQINAAIDYTQTVEDGLLIFRPNNSIDYTQDLDLPAKFTINADVDYTQSVDEARFTLADIISSEDTYLDENLGGSSFGAATSLLCKLNGAVGNNEQITYVAWDLTGISSSNLTVDAAEIDVEVSTGAALGENATFEWYTHTSKPFEEDTATWNADEQPPGTARGTTAQAVTVTPTVYTVTLPSAVLNNMLGNWFYFRMQGTTALGLATITVTSKEGTNKPALTMDITAT